LPVIKAIATQLAKTISLEDKLSFLKKELAGSLKGDYYRLFKVGYDRSTAKVELSSERTGQNLKFDCFCPKVFSSIHPFHTDSTFPEFKRRLLPIYSLKLEHFPEPVDPETVDRLIVAEDYDWNELSKEFLLYWSEEKATEYITTRPLVPKGLKLASDQKVICVDLATTGIVAGIWGNVAEANYRLNAYFKWLKREQAEDSAPLEALIEQLVADKEREAKNYGIECRIAIKLLRELPERWYEQGLLLYPPERKKITRLMQIAGYKTNGKGYWAKKV
jgi:hypothetical protein